MAMAPFLSGVKIMTDLRKGIIEINGVEIDANTTSIDIKNKLSDLYAHCAVSKNGSIEIFTFKNINLLNRFFDVDATFIRGKLKDIRLDCVDHIGLSFETLYRVDCEWLKNILGNPSQTGSNGVVYKFDSVQIGATNWENDGRSGPDEFIQISY